MIRGVLTLSEIDCFDGQTVVCIAKKEVTKEGKKEWTGGLLWWNLPKVR
jgi:hypothetical protein